MILIPLLNLIFILILLGVYFSKKQPIILENKYFLYLSLINIGGLLLEILSICTLDVFDTVNISLIEIVHKAYYIYHFTWLAIFSLYIFLVLKKDKDQTYEEFIKENKKGRFIFNIQFLIIIFIIMFINYDYYGGSYPVHGKLYPHIFSTEVKIAFYLYASINIIYYFYMLFKSKNIYNKKVIPIYIVSIGIIIMMIIQLFLNEILIVTTFETFLCIVIYLSMENPELLIMSKINEIKNKAIKANEEKTSFLSNISHEIRTPLNVIIGLSDELKKTDLNQDEIEKVNDIIISSSNLLDLVNGILDISKIETGKLELNEKEYNFEKIYKELLTLAKSRMDNKKLKLCTKYDKNIPKVMLGDELRIKQMILNIVTNAIKYSDKGTITINVGCEIDDDSATIIVTVIDEGKGIGEEYLPKLFSKYERLNEEGSNIEGTGLGLPITKKLVELMGGKIDVVSELGKGSTFKLTFKQKIVSLEKDISEFEKKIEKIDLTGKNILIVDDNELNIKVTKRKLEFYFCNTDSVGSGYECISKLKVKEYDLILMDDMMPNMTGTETLHKIKEAKLADCPIVVLTANAITGMKEKYLEEGFDDYLSKPLENEQLNNILEKFLK